MPGTKNMNKMKYLTLIFLVGLLACGTSPKQVKIDISSTVEKQSSSIISEVLAVDGFQKKYAELKNEDSDFILIDVRTPKELLETGHLEGAINMDYYSPTFKHEMLELSRTTPTLIYCKSGGRSGKTRLILKGMGFLEVYDLKDGIIAWLDADKPVVTKTE